MGQNNSALITDSPMFSYGFQIKKIYDQRSFCWYNLNHFYIMLVRYDEITNNITYCKDFRESSMKGGIATLTKQ